MIRTRDGLVYTIENGKPVLYSDALKQTIYYYETQGYFPNLSLFNKFNQPISELTLKQDWNINIKAVLPLNETDFVAVSNHDSSLLYYKNGIRQKDITIASQWKRFLKSGDNCFMLDDKNNLHLYDAQTDTFKKVNIDRRGIKDKDENINDAAFYWDQLNSQTYYLYNSIFYLIRFDATKNSINFDPQFAMKEKGHFWTQLIYDSSSSTFFLSTLTEGLFQVKIKTIKTVNLTEDLPKTRNAQNVVNYSILKTSDTTALATSGFEFTSNGLGVSVKQKGNFSSNRETIGLLADTAIICAEKTQLFYYLRSDGFRRKYVFNDSFNVHNDAYISLIYPEGDSIWIGTNKAIFNITRNRETIVVRKNKNVENVFFGIRLFYPITKDEALISNNYGLYKINTSPPYAIDTFPLMQGKQVRFVTKYKDVLLLSVYKSGLYVLKNDSFYKVPLSTDQFELNLCHSTYIDKQQNVWIPTDKGLFRSTISSIMESITKQGSVPFFYFYGTSDGISNAEFNGSGTPSYAVLGNGNIFYPSMGGIVIFKPENLNVRLLNAPIPIEKISVDDKEINHSSSDSISLVANYKYLFIDLSVPHFGEPKNLILEYSLDDSSWKKIPVPVSQRITLLGLSSGYHHLIIRKRTGFESTGYVYKRLIIFRDKHIYEQIWFLFLMMVALTMLIFLFTKWQTRRINNQRMILQQRVDEQTSELSKTVEVKELLINIISHDMITPLRHISFLSGMLSKGLEKDPEKAREVLNDIQSTSDRIMSGSLSIINWMKYNDKRVTINKKLINLYSLVNEVCEIFVPIAKEKNIVIANNVIKSKFVDIDYNIFSTILNNLISNAIKYSQKGEINIYLEETDVETKTVLKIKDTGNGMGEDMLRVIDEIIKGNIQAITTTNKLSTGLGYVMIAELIRIHGLSLSVESYVNVGTTVSIVMDN